MALRCAALALIVFAATMGFDLPAPPVPAHAVWADLALVVLACACGVALLSGQLRLLVEPVLVAYVGWLMISAALDPGPWPERVRPVVGALGLGTLLTLTAMLTSTVDGLSDRILRAWIGGVVVLGLIGLAAGVSAQLGHEWGLHRGDGELGLALRPSGLQRVGLLAELALVPLLVVVDDGERLLGRWLRRVVLVVLSVVLIAGLTRTLLAAVLGIALLTLRTRRHKAVAVFVIAVVWLAAFVIDVHGVATGVRLRIVVDALHRLRGHWLIGGGGERDVATIGWPAPHDAPRSFDAHLTLIDLVARWGVPAALLFVALFVSALRRAAPRVFAIALYATAFDSLSVDLERFRHVWLLLGLVLGHAVRDLTARRLPK